MMPEAMKTLLRDSLPGPAWERSLSEEGGKRYLATYPDDADAIRLLAKRADDAMYAAKRAGRNAVRAWPVDGA